MNSLLQTTQENDVLYFDKEGSFAKMNLDRRIFKAIAKEGYIYPTLVQAKTIPLIIQGTDILVRARTGTGKTAAYVIPILQKILSNIDAPMTANHNATDEAVQSVQALVLVPTRDLVDQVAKTFKNFAAYFTEPINILTLSATKEEAFQAEVARLRLGPHIIVTTPTRIINHLKRNTLDIASSLKTLVIDEADLILSFGFDSEISAIQKYLPKYFQSILISATITPELETLRGVFLHNPTIISLDEPTKNGNLSQYFMLTAEEKKYLMIYTHLVLGLYKGKTIFFTNSIRNAFSFKLFLDYFQIKSVVLNDDLPYNSRMHIITQFNRGIFDLLIATDVSNSEFDTHTQHKIIEEVKLEVISEAIKANSKKDKLNHVFSLQKDNTEDSSVLARKPSESDEAYLDRIELLRTKEKEAQETKEGDHLLGVTRGVDFLDVQTVVNIDFPKTYTSYVHRIGRTARAGKNGQSISYISSKEQILLEQALQQQCVIENEGTIGTKEPDLKQLPFDPALASSFIYRVEQAQKTLSFRAIRDARLKALKTEIINSTRLKSHFEENPHELMLLRHNNSLKAKNTSNGTNYIPDYLITPELKQLGATTGRIHVDSSGVGIRKSQSIRQANIRKGLKNRKGRDPLKAIQKGVALKLVPKKYVDMLSEEPKKKKFKKRN